MHSYATFNADTNQLHCTGSWDLTSLPLIQQTLDRLTLPKAGGYEINGADIQKLDSSGAWLLCSLANRIEKSGVNVSFISFGDDKKELLDIIRSKLKQEIVPDVSVKHESFPYRTGKACVTIWRETINYLSFIGMLTYEASRLALFPRRWRWAAVISTIFRTGVQALPIIALLSLMIGIVITYQMGLQLKNYGANIYIVDLLGLAILREFGPLITAIMVAGRTGSAFTAQIGMMKLTQEIDALNTLGVTPADLLILPRIIGLLVALPLLTMWADIFGIIGGMVMSKNMLSITWYDFLHRFPSVIPLRAFLIGLGKSPVFALVIASVGCYQGMLVKENADSLGKNTTRSVVISIFLIIVVDAVFSVILSELKL